MQDHTLLAQTLNHYLSLLTIFGAIVGVFTALYIAYLWYTKTSCTWLTTISRYVFPLGFFMTLGGIFLTLYYQYGLYYMPCDLCWYQRVFLYPQVFMFGYAWYKNDREVLPYATLLSVVGFAVALYHHFLQIGYNLLKPCSTAPFAVDCAKPSFVEFGFVTFPFMAVVLFGFLVLLTIIASKFAKRS